MKNAARAELPVVVIGAGPVGLAAAAHLVERGLDVVVLESGDQAGDAVAQWGHVHLFSPWRYNVDGSARELLTRTGWADPEADELPTGAEFIANYLKPLAETAEIASRLRTNTRVLAVARDGADLTRSLGRARRGYRVRTINQDGRVEDVLARAVIDASGTFGNSNPLGVGGLPAVGEQDSNDFISGPLPDVLGADRAAFAGKRSLVVGMGHSAANTLLALIDLAAAEPATQVTWVIRGGSARRLFGGAEDDALPARGYLGTKLQQAVENGQLTRVKRVSIEQLTPTSDGLLVTGTEREEPFEIEVDVVVNATGFRPDLEMLREIRLDLDPVVESPSGLGELIDPNHHSCGTVSPHGERLLRHPDDGFYLAGMKSYGRAPTFLLATGYEQVRSIAAALAGDQEAADLVHLDLPETGVCSRDLQDEDQSETDSCCAPATC